MTQNSRPNLGGLFTGSTPPERSSAVAAQLGPRLVSAPVTEPEGIAAQHAGRSEPIPAVGKLVPPTDTGSTREHGAAVPPLGPPAGQSSVAVALEFVDPLRAVERYFAVLQVVLDVNRRVAIALTTAAISLPRRAGLWR
jgi:hypothetical protein